MTPSATATVDAGSSAGRTPLPTPTPFDYRVAAGDTLSQIAEKYGVSLDALIAANPGVDPNAMSVGAMLKIPSGQQAAAVDSTPTPVSLRIEQAACHPIGDGGAWCFALVHNETTTPVENVTAQFELTDANGHPAGSQAALPPLDILGAGQSLPLSAYFAPEVPRDVKLQVVILTGVSLLPADPRYLPAAVGNSLVSVNWSGLTAQVSGSVTLPGNAKPAGLVWVAAVAYDPAGNVVGVKRWESNAGMAPGGSLPFSFMISSVAGRIERVEFAVEARPQ